jgi:putative thioredoxin
LSAVIETFQREVVEASKRLPVVVDFWAPWCGPCRTLGPIIEKVARELAGQIKLVKINSDESPELAGAFNIRSIPNVIAFKDGKPVAQFTGAQPETQVREFMRNLLPPPGEAALAQAEAAMDQGQTDAAEQLLDQMPAEAAKGALAGRIEALRQRIAFERAGENGPSEEELRAKLAADPNDHESRLALAGLLAAQRRYAQAMDELLEIVRRARDWRDGEARKQLLALLNLAAGDSELVATYRRKLASAMF